MSNYIQIVVLLMSFCLTTNLLAQQPGYFINDIQFSGYKKNKLSYLKKFVHSSKGQALNDNQIKKDENHLEQLVGVYDCLLYTSPSPRDATLSRMPSSA